MFEISAILRFENIEDYQKIYTMICGCLFIADLYNPAKVWVAHTQYTIADNNLSERLSTNNAAIRSYNFFFGS